VPAGGPAALHRLTETQLNHALSDLFMEPGLARVQLPPDVPVDGFDNNALTRDATPYLVETLNRQLAELASAEVADGGPWMACEAGGGSDPRACGRATLEILQQRAWRRPATAAEKAWLRELHDGWFEAGGFEVALQLGLQVVLQSPDFLYLVERGEAAEAGPRRLDDFEVASRLSFFLWDTMPDAALFAAAAAGELSTPEQVKAQARRMIRDKRARTAMRDYHRQWLGYATIQDMDPDGATYFPEEDGDDDAVGGRVSDLKTSYMAEFDLFVQHAVFERGTLDALLTSRQGYVSEATAELYGVDYDEDGRSWEFRYDLGQVDETMDVEMFPAQLPAEQRAGILTQGAFLAGHSHAVQPSPVLRGVFLRERLLCVPPLVPPDDVPPLEEEDEVEATTNRARYAAHTDNPACASCHISIDGAGFPFENYDSIGAWRDTDNGYPVDASGELAGTDVDGPVTDAVALAETLAASRTVYDCAVRQLYRYGMHRSDGAEDRAALAALQQNFWANGGVIPDLLVDFVSSEAFLTLPEGGDQ
jgi:hypothetical protein